MDDRSCDRDPVAQPIDSKCHFFRLSPELRNLVYDYALTAEGGVTYRHQFTEPARVLPNGVREQRYQNYPAVSQLCVAEPKQQRGETRGDGPPTPDTAITYTELNQLRYVNRQLNQETKGLVVRLNNDIFFTGRDYEETENQLIEFSNSMAAAVKTHLRTLNLKPGNLIKKAAVLKQVFQRPIEHTRELKTMLDTYRLRGFCQQNPQVTVKLLMTGLVQGSHTFLHQCLKLDGLRGNPSNLAEKLSGGNVELQRLLLFVGLSWEGDKCIALPSNVRLVPADEHFDETAFWAGGQKSNIIVLLDKNRLVAVIRDIYENGL